MMGKVYEAIDQRLARFITEQKVFFVATAPLSGEGHVNLSPKGLDTFRILDPHTVAYLDYTGSGAETMAHLRENGRIVFCFCSFEGPPLLVRIHGRGEALEPGDLGFDALRAEFSDVPMEAAVRAIIRVTATRISDSCGYGVPLMSFEGERSQMHQWNERKGTDGVARYRQENNRVSLDGLPGVSDS